MRVLFFVLSLVIFVVSFLFVWGLLDVEGVGFFGVLFLRFLSLCRVFFVLILVCFVCLWVVMCFVFVWVLSFCSWWVFCILCVFVLFVVLFLMCCCMLWWDLVCLCWVDGRLFDCKMWVFFGLVVILIWWEVVLVFLCLSIRDFFYV